MWPKTVKTEVWKCSDGKLFLHEKEARAHEQELGLDALCADVFGLEDYGIDGREVAKRLREHRALFLKWLGPDGC